MIHFLLLIATILTSVSSFANQSLLQQFSAELSSITEYKEFRKAGSTEAVADYLKATMKTLGSQSICRQLESMSYEDRSNFANALLSDHELANTACLQEISRNFELELQLKQFQLVNSSTKNHMAYNDSPRVAGRHKLGPSEARYLPANSSYNLPWDDPLPKGTFALTFDDGPHPSRTQQILDILDQQEVKATFFVLGQAIDRNPQIVREISRRGHTLGGHTYTHPDLARRSYPSAVREIDRGFETIIRANGSVDPFFRFPYGSKTNSLMNYLRSENLHHFFWRIDTLDWKKKNPNTLLNYALNQTVKAGKGIILFHDIHPQTVAMLPAFLRELNARGYRIIVYKSR